MSAVDTEVSLADSVSTDVDDATATSTPVIATPVVSDTPADESVSAPTPETLADAQTPVVPDPPRDEAERIEPDVSGPITLLNGLQADVVPLKLRETMKLLKIVTRGAGSVLETVMNDLDLNDPVAFAQTLGALILFAIPEAENEAVDFIQAMVLPVGFQEMDQKAKVASLTALATEMTNPELDDVITIVERVIRRESEDIRNLGKRIMTAFKLARKVGELPAEAS